MEILWSTNLVGTSVLPLDAYPITWLVKRKKIKMKEEKENVF